MRVTLMQVLLFLALIALVQCQIRRITVDDVGNIKIEDPSKEPVKMEEVVKKQERVVPSKANTKSPTKSKKTEKAEKTEKTEKTSKATTSSASSTKAGKAPANPPVQKIIQFRNNFDDILSLYWVNTENDKGDMKLAEIPPHAAVNTTSFVDHVFYGIMNEDDEDAAYRATPMMITIVDKVDSYSFGSVYRPRTTLHPAVKEVNRVVTNVRIKVKSLVRKGISVWVDYKEARALIYEKLGYLEEEYFNTNEGVTFYFTEHMDVGALLWNTTITKNHSYIVVEDKANPPPREVLRATAKQLRYHSDYLERTGIPWNAYYDVEKSKPRPPVHLFMWPAKRIGDVHTVTSKHSYWNCEGKARFCQSLSPLQLELEVVSVTPKVFVVPNLLSDFEAEAIKKMAKPMLEESYIGSGKNEQRRVGDARTSSNAWLHRLANPIMETLFLRAADVLQVPEHILHRHVFAEDLQVVHYDVTEKYEAHFDWSNNGYPETRFITLLIYLSDMEDAEAGGETSFPKAPLNHTLYSAANETEDVRGTGFKVQAGKCNAILFYNMLPDGNGDDLAYHAALPVIKGEKWVANFWVWDPKFH